jgi:hypothetical protein
MIIGLLELQKSAYFGSFPTATFLPMKKARAKHISRYFTPTIDKEP